MKCLDCKYHERYNNNIECRIIDRISSVIDVKHKGSITKNRELPYSCYNLILQEYKKQINIFKRIFSFSYRRNNHKVPAFVEDKCILNKNEDCKFFNFDPEKENVAIIENKNKLRQKIFAEFGEY